MLNFKYPFYSTLLYSLMLLFLLFADLNNILMTVLSSLILLLASLHPAVGVTLRCFN